MPVVTQAPGVELAADGIHWHMSSQRAVEDLIDSLVQAARSTSDFSSTSPPTLWGWRFNPTFERHYPCCIACNKEATDIHLDSRKHKENNRFHFLFDFPRREALCNTGVKFRETCDSDSPGALITRHWLRAEHPLPVVPPPRHIRNSQEVVELEILSTTGLHNHRGTAKPLNFTARVCFNDGAQTSHKFTFLGSGCHRVAYTLDDKPWVAKMQVIVEGKKNHNKEEWENFCNMSALSSLVPMAHGYAETRVRDKAVSFLFLHRVGFTYQTLLHRLSVTEPTAHSLSLVAVASTTVVTTLIRSSRDGLRPHDWHIGNIGFEDSDTLSLRALKLIDWAGNRMARAPDSLRSRMHASFKQFSGCLSEFKSWGYKGKDATVALRWHSALKSMQQALDDWWAPWATIAPGQAGDALPNDEQVRQLEGILQDVANRDVAQLVQLGESSIVLGEGGLLARRQQSEESPVPATVSYLHDKSSE